MGGVGFFLSLPPFSWRGISGDPSFFPLPSKDFFFILRLCGNVDISGRQIEWNCLCFSSSLSRLLCAKVRIAIPACRGRGADTGFVCFVWGGFSIDLRVGKGRGSFPQIAFPAACCCYFPIRDILGGGGMLIHEMWSRLAAD